MDNISRKSHDLLALAVLALLTEQPRHPYEIQRLIRERHKDFASDKTRGLYHAVDRLVRDSLAESVETTREGKRPERTVYQITDHGRDEFESWLIELIETPVTEFPVFFVAISFIGYLSAEAAVSHLQARIVALEGHIAGLEAALRSVAKELQLPRLVLLEHELMLAMHRAELEWVRSVIAETRAGTLDWELKEFKERYHAEPGAKATDSAPQPDSDDDSKPRED